MITAAEALAALCAYFLALFLFGLYWRKKERPVISRNEVQVAKSARFYGGESSSQYEAERDYAEIR